MTESSSSTVRAFPPRSRRTEATVSPEGGSGLGGGSLGDGAARGDRGLGGGVRVGETGGSAVIEVGGLGTGLEHVGDHGADLGDDLVALGFRQSPGNGAHIPVGEGAHGVESFQRSVRLAVRASHSVRSSSATREPASVSV